MLTLIATSVAYAYFILAVSAIVLVFGDEDGT